MELVRQKNVATYIVFPLLDVNGDVVSSSGNPDSEKDEWNDGGAPDGFTDCNNEATEIGSTGVYYLSLDQPEMNYDYIYIIIKSDNAKTQHILIRTIIGDPLLLASIPTVDQIADAVWDEVLTGATHNVSSSSGRRLRGLGDAVEGSVDDTSATTTEFITDLTENTENFYSNQYIIFTSGNLAGQVRIVSHYEQATKTICLCESEPLTEAPADEDEFELIPVHVHPLTEILDGVWDEAIADHTTGSTFGGKNQKVVPSETVGDYKADVTDILGLHGKHQYIDTYLFTSGKLDSCRIRIYNSKTNAETHGATGLVSTFTVTVTWVGTELESYLVVKE